MALTAPHSEAQQDVVIPLFLAHFDRAAEFEAFTYYTDRFHALRESEPDAAAAEQALAREIYAAGQSAGELPSDATFPNADYVKALYANVLGRDAQEDPEGLAYWTASLDDGVPREEAALAFITSARESERDGAFLANRSEVAAAFALPENSGPDVLPELDVDAAEILAGVTDDPATVAEALEQLADETGDGGGGEDSTLTPGADQLTGGQGDDTFVAPVVDGQQTLGSDDRIEGGAGTNTLRADLVAGAGAELAGPELIDVQQLDLNVQGLGQAGLDLAGVQGTDAIRVQAEAGADVRFDNAGDVSDYTVQGEGQDAGEGASLALEGVTAESLAVRLQDTDSAVAATLGQDVDVVDVFLENAATTLDLRAQDASLEDLTVALHTQGEATAEAVPTSLSVTDVSELTLMADALASDTAPGVTLTDASEGGAGLQTLNLAGEGAAAYTWTSDTAQLHEIDAQDQAGGVTIDATAYAQTEFTRGPLEIDGSDANDTFLLSQNTTVAGNGGDDTYVIAGQENVALLGIEDFGQGDRIEFAIPESGSPVNWVGDLSDLEIDFDLLERGLQGVRDDIHEAVGENGAGYFELDGDVYLVSTGDVGSFVNLGSNVELVGASVQDNALTLG